MFTKDKLVYKVIILGNGDVGKTALLDQYVNRNFQEVYSTSLQIDFKTKEVLINDRIISLQIWDTVGQERFNSLGAAYFRNADCCLLVFDVTNQTSFNDLNTWRDELLLLRNPSDTESFNLILLGNKIDLNNRVIITKRALQWCKANNNIPYYEVSAKNPTNVDAIFQKIAENALIEEDKRIRLYGYDDLRDRVEIFQNNSKYNRKKPSKKCC